MELFKREPRIDFLGKRRLGVVLSALLLLASIGSLAMQGLNLGIDFTGGTVVEVGYPEAADLGRIDGVLEDAGYGDAVTQFFGTQRDVMIRVPPRDVDESAVISEEVLAALQADSPDAELRRVEFVGPQVGRELTEQGLLAMLYALGGILVYVAFRFEYRFAIGSVAALLHDVILVLGFFSITRMQFDLTVLAAVLAIIGYSLNDTIVVFDRIRENFLKLRKAGPREVMNISINQTLSRTLITSFTTLLVVGSLMLVGGELIRGFATALLVGVLIGTYSSIYVASASALALGVTKYDLLPPEKEEDQGEGQEERP
ncbi:protein translocase subunit SecF [Alkalilimnicola ehrlichii MLHE-1]|uniref:Protein-export membrane protein SecF n=1 Tax=Alkalilimnicola ehrlichii (strain ATCC BAA-1101 / DSM 17681 / MLHE-1) TaxID=187272 RepID=Q0A9B9_ALKEH|nr:protein translocase subunit SecF [Alkalilimnicola ehrlichii]ABI56568.1 protein translocase subunit secF [Alkalilimnicola ehrlichii MLHE-1]